MAGAKKRREKPASPSHTRHGKSKPTHQSPSKGRRRPSNNNNSNVNSDNNSNDSTTTSDVDSGFIFPKWTVYAVWVWCTVLRVLYVVHPSSWWVLHPDEVFQSFEVAHTDAYGSGFRPYEFSSLSQGDPDGAGVSMFRQRELQLGMHSMRSALYPRFYVIVSMMTSFFGADVRPYVLWKASHACIASLLPLSVYRFVSAYFRSHDSACLATILVTLSAHLNVLGTHALLNSFLGPAVFWSLAELLPLFRGVKCLETKKNVSEGDDINSGHTAPKSDAYQTCAQCDKPEQERNSHECATYQQNNCNQYAKNANSQDSTMPDTTNSEGRKSNQYTHREDTGSVLPETNDISDAPDKSEVRQENGHVVSDSVTVHDKSYRVHTANTLMFNVKAFNTKVCAVCEPDKSFDNRHSAKNGTHILQNSGATYLDNDTNDSKPQKIKPECDLSSHPLCLQPQALFAVSVAAWARGLKVIISGVVFSLCIYIRLDIALFALFTLLPAYSPRRAQYRQFIMSALGACAGFCMGLYEDFRFYGEIVVSPGNWARFNVFQDMSGTFFGKSSVFRYLTLLFEDNIGLCVLTVVSGVLFVYLAYEQFRSVSFKCTDDRKTASDGNSNSNNSCSSRDNNNNSSSNNNKNGSINNKSNNSNFDHSTRLDYISMPEAFTCDDCKPVCLLLVSSVILLALYSFQAHKELRFIHDVIVSLFISYAAICVSVAKRCKRAFGLEETRAVLFACLCIFAASQWKSFPSAKDQSNTSWAYQRHWDSHDVNACLAYVADQKDVTGVFLDRNLHATGGCSLLHQDVPLFTLLVYEFVEFDLSSKIYLARSSVLNANRNISFFTLDRISNYVSLQNAAYLVKLLIEKTHYNYFVIERDRRFLSVGFTEVFAHGTMRVMKRKYHPDEERQLQVMAARTPMGVNSTVLRYEGDVLFRFQRFRLAAERYHAALQLNSTHVHFFQVLAACSQKLGDHTEAKKWLSACVERFGQADCTKPITMSNINQDRPLI